MGPTLRLRLAALCAALILLGCSVNAIAPLNTPSGPVTVTLESRGTPIDASPAAKEVGLVDLSLGRLTRVEYVVRTRSTPAGQPPSEWQEMRFARELKIVGEETPVAGGETYRVEESVDPVDPGNVVLRDLWRQDKAGLFNYQADLVPTAMRLTASRLALDDPSRASQITRALAVIEAEARGDPGPHSARAREARADAVRDHVPALPAPQQRVVGRSPRLQRLVLRRLGGSHDAGGPVPRGPRAHRRAGAARSERPRAGVVGGPGRVAAALPLLRRPDGRDAGRSPGRSRPTRCSS